MAIAVALRCNCHDVKKRLMIGGEWAWTHCRASQQWHARFCGFLVSVEDGATTGRGFTDKNVA
jgi:hypothetical protein